MCVAIFSKIDQLGQRIEHFPRGDKIAVCVAGFATGFLIPSRLVGGAISGAFSLLGAQACLPEKFQKSPTELIAGVAIAAVGGALFLVKNGNPPLFWGSVALSLAVTHRDLIKNYLGRKS